jgi:hypothetical protein
MIAQDFTSATNQRTNEVVQIIQSSTVEEAISGQIGPAILLLDGAVKVKYLLRSDKSRRAKVFVIVPDFNIDRDLAILQLVGQLQGEFDFDIVPLEVAHMIPDDARDV